MKVLLIDVDSRKHFPNLALMKLSAWHKKMGDEVFLNECSEPDKVFISCIFTENGPKARGLQRMFKDAEVGGSGVDFGVRLCPEIEHICPDYDLYPGTDFSMGFTSRGCIRRCPFCIVSQKEAWEPDHAELDEFLRHDKLVLLDNNLTASYRFESIVQDIIDRGIRINFNQGLDIRLLDEDKAKMLVECKARDFDFRERMLYFAWDSMATERAVKRGVDLLLDQGIRGRYLTFYILMGFDTTLEQDVYRAEKLTEWGVTPYAQIYNNGGTPEVRKFARQVNRKAIWYTLHPRPTTGRKRK